MLFKLTSFAKTNPPIGGILDFYKEHKGLYDCEVYVETLKQIALRISHIQSGKQMKILSDLLKNADLLVKDDYVVKMAKPTMQISQYFYKNKVEEFQTFKENLKMKT